MPDLLLIVFRRAMFQKKQNPIELMRRAHARQAIDIHYREFGNNPEIYRGSATCAIEDHHMLRDGAKP